MGQKKSRRPFFFLKNEYLTKLRFDFSSPWKISKFEDVCSIEMGQSPSSKNYTYDPKDTILVQGNADLSLCFFGI